MRQTATKFIDTVPWEELEHAYGPAGDLPSLLARVDTASGRKLNEAVGELCSRVLHQGTIYSASPPAVHAVIEMVPSADTAKKEYLYGLLDAFADSARMAIEDGPAPPSCAGGDPADGAAIRKELTEARKLFESDLASSSPQIRSFVASLMTFIAADDSAAGLVRRAYASEPDSHVRHAMLSGLARLDRPFEAAPDFWTAALGREVESSNRFIVRVVEIGALRAGATTESVEDLIASFVAAYESEKQIAPHDERFFETIDLLGPERVRAALLRTLELTHDEDLARILAERLLRDAFDDQRTGWGQTSRSRLKEDGTAPPQTNLFRMALRSILMLILFKLFPILLRWRVKRMMRRKPKGIAKVDYWGLKGTAPALPTVLDASQRRILAVFAQKPELWQFRTNLWDLFGLPADASGLARFLTEHS